MRNKEEIRLQRVVMALCAVTFAVFSFLFVAKYQSSLLELLYDKVATGKLKYNAYVVGASISLALTVMALWLNRFSGFKREWTALSFMPSALLLAFVTDIGRSIYTGEYCYTKWIIAFTVVIFVYAAFSYVLHRVLFAKIKNIAMSANRIIWRNLEIFCVLFSVVGFLSNSEENFKREALIASHYKKGNVEAALNVGYRSNTASRTLTAQRAYVLAKEGLLGDRLFEYPQYYGAEGLIPATREISPLSPDSAFALIGMSPMYGEKAVDFFKRTLATEKVTDATKQYYLSALLLDREIVEFVKAIEMLYPETDVTKLPKHYQEAIVLYSSIDENVEEINNLAMLEQFKLFKALETEYDDRFVRGNYARRHFGRTYWWYYMYGNM